SAGLNGLLPSPPKLSFPIPIATNEPINIIYHGRFEGTLKASRIPVITADPSEIVSDRPRRKRPMINSASRHENTASIVTRRAGSPNVYTEKNNAGISATITIRMIFGTLIREWICGDGDTVNSGSILFHFFQSVLSKP